MSTTNTASDISVFARREFPPVNRIKRRLKRGLRVTEGATAAVGRFFVGAGPIRLNGEASVADTCAAISNVDGDFSTSEVNPVAGHLDCFAGVILAVKKINHLLAHTGTLPKKTGANSGTALVPS